MAADRVRCGYPRVLIFRVSSLVLVFRPRFSGSGLILVSDFGFHPWISEINHLELKFMFYNMLMITCLLRLLNLLKVDSRKYLLFVASYLYMWICVYLSADFGYPFGFLVSAGLILVMDFHPNRFRIRVRILISDFDFRCTETSPDPNPTGCHPYGS